MRNKPITLTSLGSLWLINRKTTDYQSLKNRFFGKILFRYYYFDLLNGDMSVLQNSDFKWLLENILTHTALKHDKNLLPFLKKIAGDNNFEEGIRHRSAEILEMSWVGKNGFAETRKPQTSELLKMLKGNSVESKRRAICMIGKYRITDMLQEVMEGFGTPGLEADTAAVMRFLGNDAGNELRDYYLKCSGNINISKAVLRTIGTAASRENKTFLFERLWSGSRDIKEAALSCLIDSNFRVAEEDADRLNQFIYEIAGTVAWVMSALASLRRTDAGLLKKALNNELQQWKIFLFSLIYIGYNSENKPGLRSGTSEIVIQNNYFLSELVELIFSVPKKTFFGSFKKSLSDEASLKQLSQFFHVELREYYTLTEDLLNSDYNIVSIWTKACTLRSIKEIADQPLGESVIALIFSPETILQEEAAKLAGRAAPELYKSASQRLPSNTRSRLDKIIDCVIPVQELHFEKTKFLSNVLPGIPEERLIFLSRAMKYTGNNQTEPFSYSGECIKWTCHYESGKPESVKIEQDGIQKLMLISANDATDYIYFLPLSAVDEFHFIYPEYSFELLKYIDDNENSDI